jgi:hypothetical protein
MPEPQKQHRGLGFVVPGIATWTGIAAGSATLLFPMDTIEILLLLAPLVTVPLGLRLLEQILPTKSQSPLLRFGTVPGSAAGLLVLLSFFVSAGQIAALLCVPWLLYAAFIAFVGVLRGIRIGGCRVENLCFLTAQLYLPVGAGWLVLSRYGATPMGFAEPIILLTAVHFHFAGFAAPILAGVTARRLAGKSVRSSVARVAAIGITIAPALIAAGFVFSKHLQVLAVFLSAASLAMLSMCMYTLLPEIRRVFARLLLLVSATSILLGMALAAVYAVGEFQGELFVSIPRMAAIHGAANALGFSLSGLLGWLLEGNADVGSRGTL